MTDAQAKEYTKQLLGHYPFTYCPTLAGKTSNHTPHAGDIVLFYIKGDYEHTGYVYAVDGQKFYTIEGNTSGASYVVPNGGGVCSKSYYTSSYTTSKFYRPDYSILVKDGIFSSTTAAINAVTAVAKGEIGYLEKASHNSSYIYDKTSNAGSSNFVKYWHDLYDGGDGQAWCAIFVTWILQNAIKGGASATNSTSASTGASSASTSTPYTSASTTTYSAVSKGLSVYGTAKKWSNGSTDEVVYSKTSMDSANKIGVLDPYDTAALIGRSGSKYIVAYNISGSDVCKIGFVDYAGGASISANTIKSYKNGSTPEYVYCDTNLQNKIGELDPYETCSCLGSINGRKIVLYKVDGSSDYKVGVVEYNGGL